MKTMKRLLVGQEGSVFLIAMLALVVMLILGVAFTSRAINAVYQANRDRQDTVALSLAECGVDKALAEIYENRVGVPCSGSFTTSTGQCEYTVATPYQGIANTVEILSTGTTTHHVSAQVRVVANRMLEADVNRVFRGAIFSDNPLTLGGSGSVLPDETGLGGDMYSGGNITFKGTSYTMASTGHIYTTGVANWHPANVPDANVFEHVSPIPMPVIDLNWYQQHATTVLTGKQTIKDDFTLDGITFVDGDVSIAGQYTGQGIIVATGTIKITGNVTAVSPTHDALVLMSPTAVRLAGTCNVEGLIYAHSVTDASIDIAGDAQVRGALIADVVTTRGGITVTYSDVWSGMPLPGKNAGFTQLQQLSWQRIR